MIIAAAALLAPLLLACTSQEAAPRPPDTPVELGRVAWGRDVEAAFASARATQKPVLLFFQEVPG